MFFAVKFVRQTLLIARMELAYLARYPKAWAALLVVLAVPAVYAVMYLSSVWDPEAHTAALAVGLVNLDQGVVVQGQALNVGQEVLGALRAEQKFGYRDFSDESAARQAVRRGELAFALMVPRDFSASALPGWSAGSGKLVVYASEGNSYQTAMMARRFAEGLGPQVNRRLNERRWRFVLASADAAQGQISELRENVAKLERGARQLHAGVAKTAQGAGSLAAGGRQLNQGLGSLTQGAKQLGSGLKTMQEGLPPEQDLDRLLAGSQQLASSQAALAEGFGALKAGADQLASGVLLVRDEAAESLLVPDAEMEAVNKLASGAETLRQGMASALLAQQALAKASDEMNGGVTALVKGLQSIGAGVQGASAAVPEDSRLDEIDQGAAGLARGALKVSDATRQLEDGSLKLAAGIDALDQALPESLPRPEGSPQGLAQSVDLQLESPTHVQNSGSGFAPNVLLAALWLGASVMAFLLHVRALPREALYFYRPAQMLGKLLSPACMVSMQVAVLALTAWGVLRIPIAQFVPFVVTLLISALAFLLIVFALMRAWGDVGKGVAMFLLAIQLTSSGGILPVELSGGFFMHISPWLPLTWAVKAVKASMFDAFGGDWLSPLWRVGLMGVAALGFAMFVGQWRFVRANKRPAPRLD